MHGWQRIELVLLVPVLGFVATMAYVPHLDTYQTPSPDGIPLWSLAATAGQQISGQRDGYPYTVHVDENVHWARSAAMQRQDEVAFDDPYTGASTGAGFFSLRGAVHERGYWLQLGVIQELTGIPFPVIFQYLPAIWTAFFGLAMYALLRPHAAALPAAAFVGLMPTTARFMGPAFLVPIGFSLAWLPVALMLAPSGRKSLGAAALLAIVVGWAFFVHLIGGFAAVGALGATAVVGARRWRRGTMPLVAGVLVPVAWLWTAFRQDIERELAKEESLPIDFTIFDGWGVTALYAWALGVIVLAAVSRRRREPHVMALSLFSVAVLVMIVGSVALGLDRYATYARWHHPFFLAAAAPMGFLVAEAAAGARRATRLLRRWVPVPDSVSWGVAVSVAVLAVGGITASGIQGHLDTPYYHVLGDEDWSRFQAVAADQPSGGSGVFLAHPWKAPILNAMTGQRPYTWLSPGAPPIRGQAWDDYVRTGSSVEFLVGNDVTLIVGDVEPAGGLFEEARPGVWIRVRAR